MIMPETGGLCCTDSSASPTLQESPVTMAATKLAITADLHLPITKPDRITALAKEIRAFAPDALVLAGDLGESYVEVERCLKLLRGETSAPIWVLAGNHDCWAWPPYDSRRLWQEKLPQIVREVGCEWLEGTAFQLGDTAVAGTIAWYDYSAADPSVHASALEFAQQKFNHNADALRIDWAWSDPEFADLVAAPFLATLDHLESDPAVRRIVVVTHVPILDEQMHREPGDKTWAFSNAYFGNLSLGQKVLTRPKVSHVISGHTHRGKECEVRRAGASPIAARVLASDYEEPAWVGLTFG
jgi:3',5'-cyclic AMP phosphodiesterase CpdA